MSEKEQDLSFYGRLSNEEQKELLNFMDLWYEKALDSGYDCGFDDGVAGIYKGHKEN